MSKDDQTGMYFWAMHAKDLDSEQVDKILADAKLDPDTCTVHEARAALREIDTAPMASIWHL